MNLDYFHNQEWDDIQKEIKGNGQDERVLLLRQYHSLDCRSEYDRIIEIDVNEIYSTTDLELLQRMLLHYLHENEIVIEALPTSNVRIGHYRDYDSYHLWNWLTWEKEGECIPPIVIGTDDAGIFATNIYNEYANIYCSLITNNRMSHNEAMSAIEKLDKNGRIYKFC